MGVLQKVLPIPKISPILVNSSRTLYRVMEEEERRITYLVFGVFCQPI